MKTHWRKFINDTYLNESDFLNPETGEHMTVVGTITKIKTEKVTVLPESLDLDKRKGLLLIEKALVTVAYHSSGKDDFFCKWVKSHQPLEKPNDFVNDTHELLKQQLEKVVSGDSEDTFWDLVQRARQENIYYSGRHDTVKVIPTLMNLNDVRNRFAHPRGVFSQYEKWARSIYYLMNLALVWPKVMMEIEDTNE